MTSTRHTHGRKTFVAITATIAKTPADQFPPPVGEGRGGGVQPKDLLYKTT